MALFCNDVSHWLGANLETALLIFDQIITERNCIGNVDPVYVSSYFLDLQMLRSLQQEFSWIFNVDINHVYKHE